MHGWLVRLENETTMSIVFWTLFGLDECTSVVLEQATIIVISVGKVAFFTSSFPSSPAPGPMLIKTLMFVRVIVLLYPNIEQGGRGIFSKRENSLFSGLKWTTVKLHSLPNYFCLWLSENSGCGHERSKLDDFLWVETSSKNTRKQYSVGKKYLPYLVKTVFGAHACLYSACFATR